jgi:hypothetical protein
VRYVTDDAVDDVVVRKRLVPVIRVKHDVSNCLPIHDMIKMNLPAVVPNHEVHPHDRPCEWRVQRE